MNEQYRISVITPFHNVDMRYFAKCAQSMYAQTIGFKNIEWVIVVHNCEPHCLPELKEMFVGRPNVVIAELNDDQRTPSSPRNYGVSLATAPYVGYLDGDDSYHPSCLEEAVKNAKETDADVVCFRRDHELEVETLTPLIEIQMWNQMKRRIVIEKGRWDMQRMFSGVWVFVTSKVFRREFLLHWGIAFDLEIPYCEDVHYTINALAHAKRICYLPQLVGYHYFINAESLVQKQKKDPDTVVAYARGMAKIFATGRTLGVDLNEISQLMMTMECGFMLNSDLSCEHRDEIRKYLAPHICWTTPIPPNKAVSREKANYVYNLIRQVILCEGDYAKNEDLLDLRGGLINLQKILHDNRNSDFGEEHCFEALHTIAAYQLRVPLSRLESYEKTVNIQVSIGETGILTSNQIIGYTQDHDCLVPFTQDSIRPYVEAVATVLKGHHNLWGAQCTLSGKLFNDCTRVQTLDSAIVRNYFHQYVYGGCARPATFSTPDGDIFSTTSEDCDYALILHHALLDRAIDQIVGSDAGKVAEFFRLLVTERDAVLKRLHDVDPIRADEVNAILSDFDAGTGLPPARRLWPKLGRVVACAAAGFAKDREYVRRFVGDTTWNNGSIFLPEMVLGHAVADNSDQYVFDGTGCFCEFFRNDTDVVEPPISMSRLEVGHRYNVIVTNNAGMYRVMTSAEIRVVKLDMDGMVMEIVS